jgi:hypothetical protein
MSATIVELRVTPPFERPHVQGVLVRLSIPDEFTGAIPEIRARRYQAMDWMEHEPEAEFVNTQPRSLSVEHAKAILARVHGAMMPLMHEARAWGIHETAYRLRVSSGASSCEFNWYSELPAEWNALAAVVQEIEARAEEALSAV